MPDDEQADEPPYIPFSYLSKPVGYVGTHRMVEPDDPWRMLLLGCLCGLLILFPIYFIGHANCWMWQAFDAIVIAVDIGGALAFFIEAFITAVKNYRKANQ